MKRLIAVAALATCAAWAAPPGAEASTQRLTLGVAEWTFWSGDTVQVQDWMRRAKRSRAQLTEFVANWRNIAPSVRPADFRPANPGDPAYDWERLDATLRSAAENRLTPVVTINRAPAWAEGPNRPSTDVADPGTWMPGPKQLRQFAHALALRYSGSYVDPADPSGRPLPRVRFIQIWAEQNLFAHLNPQWRNGRIFSPHHYRLMLNHAYSGIKRANRQTKVVVGGTGPFGDPLPSGRRVPPVWFWRTLLCLRGKDLRPTRCPQPARFDIAAHNPISNRNPASGSLNAFDVTTSDVHRLTRMVEKATRTGRALPRRPKPFWATELFWDTNPPDPTGVSVPAQARYLTTSLYLLWRQGVSAVLWWYLRDQPVGPGTQQSGLFFHDGEPKLSFRAFRFPFIAFKRQQRTARGTRRNVFVWGKAPRRGRVVIEARTGRGWRPVGSTRARGGAVFRETFPITRGSHFRARQRGESSLPWVAR